MVVENLPAASGSWRTKSRRVRRRTVPRFCSARCRASPSILLPVKALPYDAAKDFTPVAMVVDFAPQMLSVNAEMPVRSVSEFVSYAKANPGKLSYGLDISVTAAVVSARLLAKRAGLDMVEVPYRTPGTDGDRRPQAAACRRRSARSPLRAP